MIEVGLSKTDSNFSEYGANLVARFRAIAAGPQRVRWCAAV
jgi:hypothetical protein